MRLQSTLRPVLDFSPYSAVLLDLDGTLLEANDVLPGAVEVVARLRREERNFAVLSNSTDSPVQVTRRLGRMGIQIEPQRIFTAAAAVAEYVLQQFKPRPRVFNLSTEGIHELLEGKVDWVRSADEACDAVISGAPSNVFATEERQRTALYLLKGFGGGRGGVKLVGVCADRVFPSPRGLEFGSGALTTFLSYASGVAPTFCGKPERIFFQELCQHLSVEPRRCLLVGDNLESDISGAKAVGMTTVLTLGGITRREDLVNLSPQRTPDHIVKDLTELV
jgi:HAD superfamily hydrolase (TIGR01450 family)